MSTRILRSLSWAMLIPFAMSAFALAETPPAQGPAPLKPSWHDQDLGHTWFSMSGDQRTRQVDRWTYNINEQGWISGQELLDIARPVDRATFEQFMRARGTDASADLNQLYKDYISSLTEQAFAILRLNRILDQEAMKRRYPAAPSLSRGYYVMRSVLVENAISRDKVPTRVEKPVSSRWSGQLQPDAPLKVPAVEMSQYTDDQLYGWLKEAVADHSVRFNIDWMYNNGGMQGLRQYLQENEVPWPSVSLSFKRLPDTAKEFENQILEKLRPTWLQRIRAEAWSSLLQTYEKRNWLRLPSNQISDTEMQQMYDALKESAFKVQAQDAAVTDVIISGAKAAEFKTRFVALLQDRQAKLLQDLFGQGGSKPSPENPDEQAKLRARILDIRSSVPREVLEAAQQEFADAITKGDLKITVAERTLHNDGATPLPTDDSTSSQQLRAVFNPMFESMALLPHFDLTDADGTIRMLFLRAMTSGQSSYLPITDQRVQGAIRMRFKNRRMAYVMRGMVYDLLKYNPFQIQVDTCSDPVWSSCLESDPAKLAEALFPETLVPGQTLGNGADGQPITSTLFHPELLDRVTDISTDLLLKAMAAPDSHRE